MLLVVGAPPGGFKGGLWAGFSNNDLADNMSPETYNYLVDDSGLTARTGCAKENDTEIGTGTGATGLHRFYDGTGHKTFIKVGADIYELAATGASTSRLTGLGASAEYHFADWLGNCFAAGGEASLYQATTGGFSAVPWLDEAGGSTSDWTSLPKPKCLVVHKEHLWFIDADLTHDGGTRIGFTKRDYGDRLFEDPLNANTYGSWLACDKADGQPLVALRRLPIADCLMAWKRRKTYVITGDYDETSNTLQIVPGPPAGAYDQKGTAVCPDGFVRWYGPEGVWEYRQDTGPRHISRAIDYLLRQIPDADRPKVCAGYWNRYFLLMNCKDGYGYAYDTERGCWVQIRGWNVGRMVVYEDDTLHAARANAGYVDKLFTGYNDNGAAIRAFWKTKFFAPAPGVQHMLRFLRARTSGESVKIYWWSDPGSGAAGSVNIVQPAPGVKLGSFLLGTDRLIDVSELINYGMFEDRPMGGQLFREIQFAFEESSISAHTVDFLEATAVPVRRDV
jgi:hypothetical protein